MLNNRPPPQTSKRGSADNLCKSETHRDEQPSPKPQNKDQVDRVTSDWGDAHWNTTFSHQILHPLSGVPEPSQSRSEQHCLPGKPSPVPQKTGGKNNLVPKYRTLRQPLHSLSNNPDLCKRQNLHLKGSHDFHLCSVHLHRLPPPSTARQIFLHDSLHHSITLAIIHRAQITSPPDSSPLGGHSVSIFQVVGVAMMPLGLIPVLPSEEHLASNIGLESPTLYEM